MNMSRDPNTTSPLGAIEGEDTMKLPIEGLCQRRCDKRQQNDAKNHDAAPPPPTTAAATTKSP